MVQVRGAARIVEDAAWLGRQLRALTAAQEGAFPEPWEVDDAPLEFIASQLKAIIGIEISIAAITGKWKVSQNRSRADAQGVVAGLRGTGHGAAMAALVADRIKPG
jgi:transcriptional regulator